MEGMMEKEERKTPKLIVTDRRKLQPDVMEKYEKSVNKEMNESPLQDRDRERIGDIEAKLPKKKTLTEQIAERKIKKQATKQARVNKVSCPNCKYIGIGDGFLFNPQLHAMICPKCGVFFMETRLRQKVLEDIKRKQESGIIVPG